MDKKQTNPTPLSKAVIYQPLVSPQEQSNHRAATSKNQNVNNSNKAQTDFYSSRKEAKVIDFLHQMSVQYNQRSQSSLKTTDAYHNTGGRAPARQEFADKLQGRGLTLVGGGFTKSLAQTASLQLEKQQQQKSNSNRWNQRKRKRSSVSSQTTTFDEHESTTAIPNVEHSLEFLNKMNQLWNDYAAQALLKETDSSSSSSSGALVDRAVVPDMEWVGAQVRIESCHSYPPFVGRLGYVVVVTRRTWCIAQAYTPKQQKQAQKSHSEKTQKATSTKNTTEMSSTSRMRHFHVPKQGSKLSILLPLRSETKDDIETTATEPNSDKFLSILLNLDYT